MRGFATTWAWYGEGFTKGLVAPAFQRLPAMPLLKLAAMAVVTDELLRDTSPDAERVIIDELTRAQAVALDDAFVNPSNLGQVDSNGQQVKPASILSGAAQVGGASPTVEPTTIWNLHAQGNSDPCLNGRRV
jgi:HK97 family phage major capsid protein